MRHPDYSLYYQLVKSATTVAYLSLIWLTWSFFDGGLDVRFAVGAIVISCLWLIITRLQIGHFFQTYYDVLSRLEVELPVILGVFLSLAAICSAVHYYGKIVAAIELVAWVYIQILYRRNRELYEKQGHGPLPKGCWLSPPAEALVDGDLMLTSGRVAQNLRESVGHAEMVIEEPDSTMKAFSSYMKGGLVLNPLQAVTRNSAQTGHYIILRLRKPLDKEEKLRASAIADEMLAENKKWKDNRNERRAKNIQRLPLPESWKSWLTKHTMASGYDWFGLFMGRLAKDHWTCIGACLELYHRLGIKTNYYGTGLLGVGTTIFDPIMPVRFLSDPALHMLTLEDKVTFERNNGK